MNPTSSSWSLTDILGGLSANLPTISTLANLINPPKPTVVVQQPAGSTAASTVASGASQPAGTSVVAGAQGVVPQGAAGTTKDNTLLYGLGFLAAGLVAFIAIKK